MIMILTDEKQRIGSTLRAKM